MCVRVLVLIAIVGCAPARVSPPSPAAPACPSTMPASPEPSHVIAIRPRDDADREIAPTSCTSSHPCRVDELCASTAFVFAATPKKSWPALRCYAVPEPCHAYPTCACVQSHLSIQWPKAKMNGPGMELPVCIDATTPGWHGPVSLDLVYQGDF